MKSAPSVAGLRSPRDDPAQEGASNIVPALPHFRFLLLRARSEHEARQENAAHHVKAVLVRAEGSMSKMKRKKARRVVLGEGKLNIDRPHHKRVRADLDGWRIWEMVEAYDGEYVRLILEVLE